MKNDFIINSSFLDDNGLLIEEFVSSHEIKKYDRSMVKYNKLRIKESDAYLFEDDKYFLLIVLGDHSLYSYLDITLYDKINHFYWNKRYQELLTFGYISLPSSFKHGNTIHHHKNFNIEIENNDINKVLKLYVKSFSENADFNAEISVSGKGESLVFLKGNKNKKEFIYKADNTLKIASGTFTFGPLRHSFNKAQSTYIFKRGNEKNLKCINLFCLHKDRVIDINIVDDVLINKTDSNSYYSFANINFINNDENYIFTFDGGKLNVSPIIKKCTRSHHILVNIKGNISDKKGTLIPIDEIGLIFLL